MRFRIGPFVYRVRIVPGLKDGAGCEHFGLCDWEKKEVLIDAGLAWTERLEILMHELKHAWQNHFGRAQTDESDADQFSTMSIDMNRQLENQGGLAALMRMTPEGIIDVGAEVEGPLVTPRAAQCPTCGGLLDMPIRTKAAEMDADYGKQVAWRAASCDFCSHEVTWRETVTSSGLPTGTIIGDPVIRQPRAA